MKDDHMTDEEIANAEAAITLAVVPEEERLPEELRARVEADARAFLGQRAKDHARRRAETAAPAQNMDSTTAAGSQVLAADDDEPVKPKAPLLPYAGWLVAVAASVALFVSHNRGSGSAGTTSGTSQEIAMVGAGGAAGTVTFDRTRGTGVFTLGATPPSADGRDRLQLWLTFEGDAAPRPVLLVANGSKETPFGTESSLCVRGAGLETRSGAGVCAAIRAVQVTRAPRSGVLVFEPAAVVMKADASP